MLEQYPTYKPSGIEWLGEIPENWDTLRLKYLSSINDDVLPESTDPDYEILYIDIGSIDAFEGIREKELMRFENAPSRARRCVQNGDVIVSTVRTYLRAIASIHEPEENLIVSTGFAVVRPKTGLDGGFSAYALRTPYFVDTVVARSVGVSYPAINASEIGTIPIAIPSFEEQRAIAAFLDRGTRRIDELIKKKERQIELLKEKRAALISHAVTKGLNPNAKMKPSGIEWLGEVPDHWDAVPLRWYLRIGSGSFLSNTKFVIEPMEGFDIPVIGGNGVMGFTDRANISTTTIAVGRVGAYCGNIHLIKVPVWVTDNALMISDIRTFKLEYLSLLLELVNMNRLAKQNTQPLVTGTMVKEQSVPLPSISEQRTIAAFLDRETGRIDELIDKVRGSIEKLREYRVALISAAVTGKIDIREKADNKNIEVRPAREIVVTGAMRKWQEQNEFFKKTISSPMLTLVRQQEQLQRAFMPIGGVFESIQSLNKSLMQHQEFIRSITKVSKASGHVAHLMRANQSWFDLIEKTRLDTDIFKQIYQMHNSWQEAVRPFRNINQRLKEITTPLMEVVSRRMVASERLLAGIDFNRLKKHITLPEKTMSQFNNTLTNLSRSYGGLTSSIGNIPDLVAIPKLALPGASRELLTSSYAISTLDLEAQADGIDENFIAEAKEEISDLPSLLKTLDPALLIPYNGAKEALASGSTDRARHVLISLRELTTHVLHRLAPDKSVREWIPADKVGEYLHKGRPKRKTRMLFICRDINHGPLVEFVQKDSDMVLALFDLLNRVHAVEPNMTDQQLRAIIFRTESWVSYIISLQKETSE